MILKAHSKPEELGIGTPAVTTRGMKEPEMLTIADFIDEALKNRDNAQVLEEIRLKVVELNKNFPLP